jgi:isopentenyl-diphosphate delta-isomerase
MLRGNEPSDGAFWDWGIPTAVSTTLVSRAVKIPVIASGGVRSGVDVAKGIALGASMGGAALPFLRAWGRGGKKGVSKLAGEWVNELKMAMALTGCRQVHELGGVRLIITGKTSETLCAFGCFPSNFVSREQR